MMAKTSIQVVVVGAGMGGLGAAIALRKAGHRVIVLEQAPEFSEVSYSITNNLNQSSHHISSLSCNPLRLVTPFLTFDPTSRLVQVFKCLRMHHES